MPTMKTKLQEYRRYLINIVKYTDIVKISGKNIYLMEIKEMEDIISELWDKANYWVSGSE